MSEDLRKRQRVEDREIVRPTDQNTDILKSKLDLKDFEISTLKQEIDLLSSEKSNLSSYISRFSSSLAMVITDIQTLCQAYSVDQQQSFPGAAFPILSKKTYESIPELFQLLKSCIQPLLVAIEKFKSGYSSEEINKKCLALQEGYISYSSQLSECKAEMQQVKDKNAAIEEKLRKSLQEIESLKREKEKLVIEITKNANAANCKCRCRCGARKSESDEPFDDVKEIKAELERIKDEKMFFEHAAEEKSEKLSKLQMELEVSEERLVKTKAFKSLVNQAREVAKSMEVLKKSNEDLKKQNDEFTETKNKELRAIVAKEEDKRIELENQIRNLTSKLISLENEKNDAVKCLEITKKEQFQLKTNLNFKSVIDDLEDEKNRLKKQLQETARDKGELFAKLEEEQKKVYDLKEQLVFKDIALQKSSQENISETLSDNLVELRLKEYRNEVNDLRNHIKIRENNINKLENALRTVKNDLKAEKKNSEALNSEVEATGNAYEEALKKYKALASQLMANEQNCMQLMNEKRKEENWKNLLESKQRVLEEQKEAKDNLINSLQDVIKEEQKISNKRLEVINSLDAKFKMLEQKFLYLNSSQIESNKRYEELLISKKEIQDKLKQAEKICIKSATDCMQYKFLYENCEKSLKELQESLSADKDNHLFKSVNEIYISEIVNYRDLLRCSLCRIRNKDSVLTKCFHMFCRKCLDLNLNQKNNKCQACYIKYSPGEIRPFNWN